MLVKTFENNGRNISKHFIKLNLEQNIKSVLYNHLVYKCTEVTHFSQFYDIYIYKFYYIYIYDIYIYIWYIYIYIYLVSDLEVTQIWKKQVFIISASANG